LPGSNGPRVAVTRKLLAPIEARMSELFDASLNDDDHEMTAEEIVALAQGCDVLVPNRHRPDRRRDCWKKQADRHRSS
jgi:glyoxylate reductase